jgi:hypothetical protein
LLANNSDVNIVGIESREDRVKQADKRIENDKSKKIFCLFLLFDTHKIFDLILDLKDRILNLSLTLDEDCINENKFLKIIETKLNNETNSFGMISLHSCGDLTPNMLKLFLNENKIKFLAAFSCCYHSMKYNENGI